VHDQALPEKSTRHQIRDSQRLSRSIVDAIGFGAGYVNYLGFLRAP